MAMIKFDHVDKYYGKFHALKNINLEFEKGEVVVVIGPSGSGKSTMLRCINGLETISSGKLLINDTDLHDKKTKLTEVQKTSAWFSNISICTQIKLFWKTSN